MQKINFQNLPNTTTPVNATNMNQLQTNVENAIDVVQSDTNTRAQIVYSATQTSLDGTKTYTFPNSADALYLVMVHTTAGNALRFDVVKVYNGSIYTTTLHTSNYITLTYSGLTASITVQYTNSVRIIKL